jgi:hypothetical protein
MTFQPFIERIARVDIKVQRPDNSGTMQDLSFSFQQHRMRISVRQGGNQYGNAHVEIFGMPLDAMNQIARLWLDALKPQNTDTLEIAVWDGTAFVSLFQGVITWSAVDASGMPAVKLVVEANAAFALANATASPYANAGPITLKDTLTSIVSPVGFTVDYSAALPEIQLVDTRVQGSPLTQVSAVMNAFPKLRWLVNLQRLIVFPTDAPFAQDPVRVAADNGLVGNPVYSTSGLQFATIYNPQLAPGVYVDIESGIFDLVNKTKWVAAVIAHELEPNVPGGKWHTSVGANNWGPKGNNQS